MSVHTPEHTKPLQLRGPCPLPFINTPLVRTTHGVVSVKFGILVLFSQGPVCVCVCVCDWPRGQSVSIGWGLSVDHCTAPQFLVSPPPPPPTCTVIWGPCLLGGGGTVVRSEGTVQGGGGWGLDSPRTIQSAPGLPRLPSLALRCIVLLCPAMQCGVLCCAARPHVVSFSAGPECAVQWVWLMHEPPPQVARQWGALCSSCCATARRRCGIGR